jgi:hypothetical protein
MRENQNLEGPKHLKKCVKSMNCIKFPALNKFIKKFEPNFLKLQKEDSKITENLSKNYMYQKIR